jgi:hypothetical protein
MVMALMIGSLIGFGVASWLYHRRYWLLPRDRTFRHPEY